MNFKINRNMGCLIGVVVLILVMSIIGFFGKLVFTTPVGLVLVAYLGYRWYKKNKELNNVDTSSSVHYTNPDKFSSDESEIVDVEFEDFE